MNWPSTVTVRPSPGQTVTTHYVGWAFSTGEEFDASWNRGDPLSFRAGIGQVIRGWDQGLLGMKVGFDNGGPISAYIEGRNLTNKAYIASVSIINQASAASEATI